MVIRCGDTRSQETWQLYSSPYSIYHGSLGDGTDNWKWVAPKSGRELVIKIGPSGDPEVDLSEEYRGTYNYSTGVCHVIFDVLPYYWEGNGPADVTNK